MSRQGETGQGGFESKLERLRTVVSAYGGDADRWPLDDQAKLREFAKAEPDAQAIVRDGQSFDQLLDHADAVTAKDQHGDGAFADRVFASIVNKQEDADRPIQQDTNNVIDLASRRKSIDVAGQGDEVIASRAGWMSAAALAASLVIGVMLGANGYVESATSGLGEIAGLMAPTDTLQLEDGLGPVEEDYL